jgi:hypothetical protein
VLYGGVSRKNEEIIPDTVTKFSRFSDLPYAEVGYGIENIFKIFRIEAFHRLTYLDRDVSAFGIKGTIQVLL